jgi:hypothetical protein
VRALMSAIARSGTLGGYTTTNESQVWRSQNFSAHTSATTRTLTPRTMILLSF